MTQEGHLKPFHDGITPDGLSTELTTVVRAFGRALQDWWRLRSSPEEAPVEHRAKGRTLLVQRTDAVLELGQDTALQVETDRILVRGLPLIEDPTLTLAPTLHQLGILGMTLCVGLRGLEFVRFLELCETEPPGNGIGELLWEALPEALQLDVDEPETTHVFEETSFFDDTDDEDDEDDFEFDLDFSEDFEVEEPVEEPVEPIPEPRHFASVDALGDLFERMQVDSSAELREEVVGEVFEQLMEVSRRSDEEECDAVAAAVSELGNQLVVGSKLGTWIAFLRSLHSLVVREYSLGATKVCQDVLDTLGGTRQILCVLLQYDSESPPSMQMIADYMTMVPATALPTVSRCDHWFQTPQLRRLLLKYLREASPNNRDGILELAEDPDFGFAGLAVDVLGDIPESIAEPVFKACLTHQSKGVRIDAVRQAPCLPFDAQVNALPTALKDASQEVRMLAAQYLGECGSHEAVTPILQRVSASTFEHLPAAERVALMKALAVSGRPEALFKVEEFLIPRSRGFVSGLKSRFSRQELDQERQHIVNVLVKLDRPQTREILHRGARSHDAPLARVCQSVLVEEEE